MPFIFVFLLVAVFIVLAVVSSRKLSQRRAAMHAEIDSMRAQMQACVDQCRGLDEKTQERVGLAQQSIEAKLQQAAILLPAAVKDRHFERIGRIFALVQTKLGNVRDSIERSHTRADERVQRQADAAQRREAERAQRQAEATVQRTGSFGGASGAPAPKGGSFAPPEQVTDANTAWSTIPLNERGACFFCSRPCMMRELTPVVIPLGGTDRRVLACPADFAAVRSGAIPPIRSFDDNGRPVPWYAYRRYDPYNDYYDNGTFIYVDTYPYSAFDSVYWDFNGGYMGDGGSSFNFSPDTEAYQDYSSGVAAGSIYGTVSQGGTDVQGMDDHVGSVDFGNAAPGGDFGAEMTGPDIS